MSWRSTSVLRCEPSLLCFDTTSFDVLLKAGLQGGCTKTSHWSTSVHTIVFGKWSGLWSFSKPDQYKVPFDVLAKLPKLTSLKMSAVVCSHFELLPKLRTLVVKQQASVTMGQNRELSQLGNLGAGLITTIRPSLKWWARRSLVSNVLSFWK